nr:glycosyltransferase [Geodermatophilus africanus]
MRRTFPEIGASVDAAAQRYVMSHIFCGVHARAMMKDILDMAENWLPDIIMREVWEFGGLLAARVLKIPCVLHGIGQWRNNEDIYDIGGGELEDLCDAVHLRRQNLSLGDRDLYIDPCPPSLQLPTRRPYPTLSHGIRPIAPDEVSPGATVPVWRWGASERPVVYVSLGTVMNHRAGILETIVAGLHSVVADVAVSVGPGRSPDELGTQPPHVHVDSYVPFSHLAEKAALVICHGGWSTVIGALAKGVPVVCVPMAADNFSNARSCEATGVGLTVRPEELTSQAIRSAAEEVLGEENFRRAARRIRAEIAGMPMPWQAAAAVGALKGL